MATSTLPLRDQQPAPDGAAVRLPGLRKSLGRPQAVRGVDLVIAPGEVVAFLGPSGGPRGGPSGEGRAAGDADRRDPRCRSNVAAESLSLGESPLTNRERDVLSATTAGGTVAEIAARLFLSEGTVRNHLSSVIGKTGARTRADAVRIATDRGWI